MAKPTNTWRGSLATRPTPLDRVEVALLLLDWLWRRWGGR